MTCVDEGNPKLAKEINVINQQWNSWCAVFVQNMETIELEQAIGIARKAIAIFFSPCGMLFRLEILVNRKLHTSEN